MAKIIGNPTVTPINTYTKKEIDDKIADIQVGGSGSDEPFIIEFDDVFSHRGNKDFYEIIVALEAKRRICVLMKSVGVIHEVGAIARGATVIGLEICGTYKVYLECFYTNEWTYNVTPLATEKYVDDKIANIQTGEGGNIIIDNAMSDTSENAVQNKVIKNYVDEKSKPFVIDFEYVPPDMTIGDKTYEEITEAISQGRRIVGKYILNYFTFTDITETTSYVRLVCDTGTMCKTWYCWNDVSVQPETNGWGYSETNTLENVYTKTEVDKKIEDFVINLTIIDDTSILADKDYESVKLAIETNKNIVCIVPNFGIMRAVGHFIQENNIGLSTVLYDTTFYLTCTSDSVWTWSSTEFAELEDVYTKDEVNQAIQSAILDSWEVEV